VAFWNGVVNAGNTIINGCGMCFRADLGGVINGWGNQQSGNSAFAIAGASAVITSFNA
jgi:hypothetical protein